MKHRIILSKEMEKKFGDASLTCAIKRGVLYVNVEYLMKELEKVGYRDSDKEIDRIILILERDITLAKEKKHYRLRI